MKIAVFGSTGQIGKLLVEQALDEGLQVVAYARDPSKLDDYKKNQNLIIVEGQLSDKNRIEEAINGVDAVLSMLGPDIVGKVVGMPISQGTQNIVDAMEKNGVKRLIVIATQSVPDPNDSPTLRIKIGRAFVRLVARHAYDEVIGLSEIIQSSDLDWTIVRFWQPTDGKRTGNILHGYVGKTSLGGKTTRADIAEFSFEQLTDKTYIRKMPAISN